MDEELSQVIAMNARSLRAASQARQEDVAALGGVSRPVLSKIESGDRRLRVEDILILCRGLGCTFEDLVSGAPTEILIALGLGGKVIPK